MTKARSYRFGDSAKPGLLLGLSGAQAVPLVSGTLLLAAGLQVGAPPPASLAGLFAGIAVAFGRVRGVPLAEVLRPGLGLAGRRAARRTRWLKPSLVGDNTGAALPRPLRGVELLEEAAGGFGVVVDRADRTVTGVVRVQGAGFQLASTGDRDAKVNAWGAALSSFARERSAVAQITWQEWAHDAGSDDHDAFLASLDLDDRTTDVAAVDYLALVDDQAPTAVAHDVLVAVTVDQRRVRPGRDGKSRFDRAVDTLREELRLFANRLEVAGLDTSTPLPALEVSAAVRTRSDPARARQIGTLQRSLAAAARRGALEWGPMVVDEAWGHLRVDGAWHRSYRVAGWPQLPVPSDWMHGLLMDTGGVRTVTVVLEPVPMSRAARAADREVMARESDADLKAQKGFRITAKERKRLADVEARERELAEGHAEFAFVGIVTVTAQSADELDDRCADVEQAAAQCLLDLRPLDARHDLAWVTSLPLGRALDRRNRR